MMNHAAVVLSRDDRMRIVIGLELYLEEMRKACKEDQNNPEGEPGTVGYTLQREFKGTLERFKQGYPQY